MLTPFRSLLLFRSLSLRLSLIHSTNFPTFMATQTSRDFSLVTAPDHVNAASDQPVSHCVFSGPLNSHPHTPESSEGSQSLRDVSNGNQLSNAVPKEKEQSVNFDFAYPNKGRPSVGATSLPISTQAVSEHDSQSVSTNHESHTYVVPNSALPQSGPTDKNPSGIIPISSTRGHSSRFSQFWSEKVNSKLSKWVEGSGGGRKSLADFVGVCKDRRRALKGTETSGTIAETEITKVSTDPPRILMDFAPTIPEPDWHLESGLQKV